MKTETTDAAAAFLSCPPPASSGGTRVHVNTTPQEPVGPVNQPAPFFLHASDEDLDVLDAGMAEVEAAIADIMNTIETLKARAEEAA